jgi:hypothetical protein
VARDARQARAEVDADVFRYGALVAGGDDDDGSGDYHGGGGDHGESAARVSEYRMSHDDGVYLDDVIDDAVHHLPCPLDDGAAVYRW